MRLICELQDTVPFLESQIVQHEYLFIFLETFITLAFHTITFYDKCGDNFALFRISNQNQIKFVLPHIQPVYKIIWNQEQWPCPRVILTHYLISIWLRYNKLLGPPWLMI